MTEIECPYCNSTEEINHDDGHGYDEDVEHEQQCEACDKWFKYTTSISYNYEVLCQDEDHVMEPFGEQYPNMFQCRNCDFYERKKDD